jgi:thiamine biosynthesis lipoprotein
MLVPVMRPLLAIALIAALPPACARRPDPPASDWYEEQRFLYHGIPVAVRFRPRNEALARQVWARLEGVDATFNDYREGTEVGRLNQDRRPRTVTVSSDLADVLRLSRQVHDLTDGAFDPTIRPVLHLWKQAAREGREPDATRLAAARAAAGLRSIHLKGTSLTLLAEGSALDPGGIVKGWAVDRAIDLLRAGGARSAIVQVGGETAAFGPSPRRKPAVVGIRHPDRADDVYTAVRDPGTGIGCSTSGNYERPIVIAGKPYYHIIDPRTGQPVPTPTASVTVVFRQTGRNGLADGLATAGAVLPVGTFLSVVTRLGGEALVLVRDGGTIREHATPGWKALAVDEARPPSRGRP